VMKYCYLFYFLHLVKIFKKTFVAKIIKFKHNPKKNDLGLDAIMNVCFPIKNIILGFHYWSLSFFLVPMARSLPCGVLTCGATCTNAPPIGNPLRLSCGWTKIESLRWKTCLQDRFGTLVTCFMNLFTCRVTFSTWPKGNSNYLCK
jgi:hypothetical protein